MWPTPELTNQVAGAIRAGAYAHVAAAAYGVPRQAFRDWMRRGRLQRRGACRDFWTEVEKAKSLTRALAEREVREQDIRFWLRFGPGKGGGP